MSDEHDETGRISVFKNKDHEPGGKQPAFKGTISIEGSSDKRSAALWARRSKKTGKTYFHGRAGESAANQIDKLTEAPPSAENEDAPQAEQTVKPNEIKLWPNQNKEPGSKQPDFFGYYNPDNGAKLQRLDVWASNDRYGQPMLDGKVREHKPKKELDLTQEQPKRAKKKKRAMSM